MKIQFVYFNKERCELQRSDVFDVRNDQDPAISDAMSAFVESCKPFYAGDSLTIEEVA